MILWHRRGFVLAGGFGLFCATMPARAGQNAAARLERLEKAVGGRVGVAALDTESGARIAWRGDEHFAMCSTFKWMLVAAILLRCERGALSLERRIAYTSADLLPHSPVTAANVRDGEMTVAALSEAAVEMSDNAAAMLLLRLVGGPAGLTQFLRRIGDPVTRLDRREPALNTNLPGDLRDTTTPNAMVGTMRKLLAGDVLEQASRDRLIGWMVDCRTGLDRLRAGLPRGWRVGDKTGTGTGAGPTSAVNDLAIAWPPGRKPVLIASYLSGSSAPIEMQNATHARIGRIVAEIFV